MASAMQSDSKTVFLGQLSALVTEVRQVVRSFSSSNAVIADLERSSEDILQAVQRCREEHAALRTVATALEEDGETPALVDEEKSLGALENDIATNDGEEEGNALVPTTTVRSSSVASESVKGKRGGSTPPPSPSSVEVPAKDGSVTGEDLCSSSAVTDSSAPPVPLASFSSSTLPLLTSSLRSLSLKSESHGKGEERMQCLPPDQGIGSLSLLDLIQWISKLFLVEPPDPSTIVAALSASTSGSSNGSNLGILNRTPAARLRMLGRNLLQMVQVRCVSALREYLHFVLRLTYSSHGVPPAHPLPTAMSPTAAPSVLSAVQLGRAISSTSFALKECVLLANTLYQPEVVAAAEQILSAGGGRGGAVSKWGTPAPPFGSSSENTSGGSASGEEGVAKEKAGKEGSGRASTTAAAAVAPSATTAIAVLKHARFPLQVAMDVVKEVHKMMRTFSSVMEREEYVRWSRHARQPPPMHSAEEEGESTFLDSAQERVTALEQQWGSSLAHALREIAPSITPAVEFLASVAIPLSASQRSHWSLSLPPSSLSFHSGHTPRSTSARFSRERDRVEISTASLSATTTSTSSNPLQIPSQSQQTMTRKMGGRSQSVMIGGTYSSENASPLVVPPLGVEASLALSQLLSFPTLPARSSAVSPATFTPHTSMEARRANAEEKVSFPPDEKQESYNDIPSRLREEEKHTLFPMEKRQSRTVFIHLVLTQLGWSFIMEMLVILANFSVYSMEDSGSSNSNSASGSGVGASGGSSSLARNGLKEERGVAASRMFSETVREASKFAPVLLSSMLAAQKRWRNSIFNYILVRFLSLPTKGGGWPAALEDLRVLTIAVFTHSPMSGKRAHTITCSEIGCLYTRCIFRLADSPNTPLYVKRELVVHLVQTFLERPSFTSSSPFADRTLQEGSPHSLTSFSARTDATPHIPLLLRMYYCFDLDVHAHSMSVVQQFISVLCRLVRSSPAAELWKEVEKQAQFPRARKVAREEIHDGRPEDVSASSRVVTAEEKETMQKSEKKALEQVPPPTTTAAAPPPASPAFLALQGLLMVTDVLKTLEPPEKMMEPGIQFFPSSSTNEGGALGEGDGVEPSVISGPSCHAPEAASLCKAYAVATLQALREEKQKEQYVADVFNRSSTKAIQRLVVLIDEDTNPPGTEAFSTSWEATKLPPPTTKEAEAKIEAVANFIWCSPQSSLQLEAVADYITSPNVFSLHVCRNLLQRLPLRGLPLVAALEELLLNFALPKEGQRIERLLEFFCDVYFDANQGPDIDTMHAFPFADKDACFLVTVATVMLNTSLHNRRVASAMTSKVFCDQLRGCNGEKEFTTNYLENLYQRIAQHPLRSTFSSPGVAATSLSSFFSLSVSENEEIAGKVMDSLFISTEEKKSVSFGLERQRVMAEVHQALYARVMPSPAMPLPVDLPVSPSSSSFLSSFQWWAPLQVAKDFLVHSWSSISAVWNPSFHGKVDDPVELLAILPTCLRGLQGLLEVAAAFALPAVVEPLLQAMTRIERLAFGSRLLFPIQEASRWAVFRLASSPCSIHLTSSCWRVVFQVMSHARAERHRTLHPNTAPANRKGGLDGSSGSVPPPARGLSSSTISVEEEVLARIEAWVTVVEEQEWREREILPCEATKDDGEDEGGGSSGMGRDVNGVEVRAKPIPSVGWKASDEETSGGGVSSSTSAGKDDTVSGASSSGDGSALSGMAVPSSKEGVHHVLQALMEMITQEIVTVMGDSSAGSMSGTGVQQKERKGGEREKEVHGTPEAIVHPFAILERCLCATKIIRDTTWYPDGLHDGNGGTRVLQSIYVGGVHQVVMPGLVALLEKMMDTPVPLTALLAISSHEGSPTAATTPSGSRAGEEVGNSAAFHSLNAILLPAMGAFLTKVCRLLWVSATRCGSGVRTAAADAFPSPSPPLDHGRSRTAIPAHEKSDDFSRSVARNSTESAAPLPYSPLVLTEAMFPFLPKCLECFDFFRVVLFHMKPRGVEEDEQDEEVEEEAARRPSSSSSSLMWYTVRNHVLQWMGQLAVDTMPSSFSNPSLLAMAALLPSSPMRVTRPWDIRTAPLLSLSFPLYALWHRLLSPLVWMFSSPGSPPPSYLSRFLSASSSSSSSLSSSAMHRPSSSFQTTTLCSPQKRTTKKKEDNEEEEEKNEKMGGGKEAEAFRYVQQWERKRTWSVLVQCVESCTASSRFLVEMAAPKGPAEPKASQEGHLDTAEEREAIPSLAPSPPSQSSCMNGASCHRLVFLLHPPLVLLSHLCYLVLMSNTPERLPPMEGNVSSSRSVVRLLSSLCAAGLSLFHIPYPSSSSLPADVLRGMASSSSVPPTPSSASLPLPTYHQLWIAFVLQMEMALVATPVLPPHEKRKDDDKEEEAVDAVWAVRPSFTAYPIHLLERLCLLLRCEHEDIREEVLQQLSSLLPLLSPSHSCSTSTNVPPAPPVLSAPGHLTRGVGRIATPPPPPSSSSSCVSWRWTNTLHYHLAVLLIRVLQSSTAVLRSGPLSLLSPELVSFWLFLVRDMPPSMRFCSRTTFRTTSLDATLRLLVEEVVPSCPVATRWAVGSLVLEHSLTLLIASPCTSLETKQRTASYLNTCLSFLFPVGVARPAAVQDLVWRCAGWMLAAIRPFLVASLVTESAGGGPISSFPSTVHDDLLLSPLPPALHPFHAAFQAYLQDAEEMLQVVPLVNWRPVGRKRTTVPPHHTAGKDPHQEADAPQDTSGQEDPSSRPPSQEMPSPLSAPSSPSQRLLHLNSLLPIEEEGPFDVLCRACLDSAASQEKPHSTTALPASPTSCATTPRRRRASFQRVHVGAESPHHPHRRRSSASSSSSLRRLAAGEWPRRLSQGELVRPPPADATPDPSQLASSHGTPIPTSCRSRRSSSVRAGASGRHHRSPSGGQAPRMLPDYHPLLHDVLDSVCGTLEWLSHAGPTCGTTFTSSTTRRGEEAVGQAACSALHPPIHVAPDISSMQLLLLLGEVLHTLYARYAPVLASNSPLPPFPLEGGAPLAASCLRLPPSLPVVRSCRTIEKALQSYLGVALRCMGGHTEDGMSLPLLGAKRVKVERKRSWASRCRHGEPLAEDDGVHPHHEEEDEPAHGVPTPLPPQPKYPVGLLCAVFCAWGEVYRRLGEEDEKLPSSSSSSSLLACHTREGDVSPEGSERHAEPCEKQTTSSVVAQESTSSSTGILSCMHPMQVELHAALASWIRLTLEVKKWYSPSHKESSEIASFPHPGHAWVGEYLQRFVGDEVCATVVELLPSTAPQPVDGVIKSYLQWYLERKKERVLETDETQEKKE